MTPGDDPRQAADIVAPYAEAGVTWWIESIGPIRGALAELRVRSRQGPPSRDGGFVTSGVTPYVEVSAMLPETKYAKSGDVHIAYQVLGSGRIDLVFVSAWVFPIEVSWEEPSVARFFQRGIASS